MEKTPPPICNTCQQGVTARHILLECRDLKPTRDAFFKETTMQRIFSKVKAVTIIDDLKVDHYDKI